MSRLRTRVALFSATTLAATAAVATFTVGSSTASSSPAAPTVASSSTISDVAGAKKGVTIKGAVHNRGPISRADLEGLKQLKFKFKYQTDGGQQSHTYTGPLLLDVLNVAEPAFSADRHDPLRYAILFKASDGFLAALSWGEIATDLENKHVIVALTEDGKKLDRPRLVVPRDQHGARQVYDLASITLLRLSAALAKGDAGAMSEDGSTAHNH